MIAQASKRNSGGGMISQVKEAAVGREADIIAAIDNALPIEDVLSRRKFRFPGQPADEKPKAKVNNPNTGAGQCDATGKRWSDWIGFAKEVRGFGNMGEAAKFVADAIGFKTRRQGRRSLEACNWSPTLAAMFLKRLGCDPGKQAKLREAGFQIVEYQGKAIRFPFWGRDGSKRGPVNETLMRPLGGTFTTQNGELLTKKTRGKQRGILADAKQFDNLLQGDKPTGPIIKCEGITDWVAGFLRDDLPEGAFLWTNPFGCGDGSSTLKNASWSLEAFAGCEVWIVHDADSPGQKGAIEWCEALAKAGATAKNIELPFTETATKGEDLRDYFAEGGDWKSLCELAAEAKSFKPVIDPRRAVTWDDNELRVVEQTIDALSECEDIYQRAGRLQDVPKPAEGKPLAVRRLPLPHLRSLITSVARFVQVCEDGEQRPKRIPESFPKQVDAFGRYEKIREIEAVCDFPFLRSDGSVCSQSGYDPQTKTLVRTAIEIELPESPTLADANEAGNRILDLVRDFDFQREHHRSAWLAALLTAFCKPAIQGCCPLFIFEASMQGAGKTRLVDVISTIATGRTLARNPWPSKDEEVSKTLTTIVLSGAPLVLFDNCKTTIGGQAIEAFGSAEYWKSRVLGRNEEIELPIRQVLFLTGNNARVTMDIARRSCIVRLEPQTEDPDNRSGFKYPDLLGHVAANREQLMRDVFVILMAFVKSKEQADLEPWGSFEAWSNLVRGAIAWLGLPDPIEGTFAAKEAAKHDDGFVELLQALEEAGLDVGPVNMLDDARVSFSSAEILERAEHRDVLGNFFNPALRDFLLSAFDNRKMTSQRVGKLLQGFDGRIAENKKLFSRVDRKKKKLWSIKEIAGSAGVASGVQGDHSRQVPSGNLPSEKDSAGSAGVT
ncbi:hypothetical protein U8335_11400 [Roseiconus lacunae]|uniref:hypothetical protein n=1 Tax=Roseiconus lacunae TaxID=2605694 RepID=UPI0030910442|nr:hypothetical protein U8335_11400 [Stieleria sp. HD01]